MSKIFFFDSETTGVNKTALCLQLAGMLVDEERRKSSSFDCILEHKNITEIPQVVIDIHGITLEDLKRTGIRPAVAFAMFIDNVKKCDYLAGYNIDFDLKIMKYLAETLDKLALYDSVIANVQVICVMKLCCDTVKMPATAAMIKYGKGPYKNPKLSEAYQFFFNKPMPNAHRADADVNATMKIFYEMKRLYP